MGNQRSGVLELAILGILHETPMHGYELRKRLNSLLGAFRAFGYGSLYPALKDLLGKGLIAEDTVADPGKPLDRTRRSKIVYRLSEYGKERLNDLLGQVGQPRSWEDDGFGVHFAFFGLTQAEVSAADSWKAAAAGWKSGSRDSAPRRPGPGNGSTATPWSCSGTGSSQLNERFAAA